MRTDRGLSRWLTVMEIQLVLNQVHNKSIVFRYIASNAE